MSLIPKSMQGIRQRFVTPGLVDYAVCQDRQKVVYSSKAQCPSGKVDLRVRLHKTGAAYATCVAASYFSCDANAARSNPTTVETHLLPQKQLPQEMTLSHACSFSIPFSRTSRKRLTRVTNTGREQDSTLIAVNETNMLVSDTTTMKCAVALQLLLEGCGAYSNVVASLLMGAGIGGKTTSQISSIAGTVGRSVLWPKAKCREIADVVADCTNLAFVFDFA